MLCEILEPIQTRRGLLPAGTRADIPEEIFLKLMGKVRRLTPQPERKLFEDLRCGECLYLGWKGVRHYCRHPTNPRLINGVDCEGLNYIDRYKKRSPTKQIS